MRRLAIIPARGGSKRIPRKNVKHFIDKPILAYSIQAALDSGLFDEVMVSTDDLNIAAIARSYGASIPFYRSENNSDDFATTMDVLKEVEKDYFEKIGKQFDLICCIYPTAPLVTKEHLIKGLNTLIENSFDAVYPLVSFSYPIWRGVEISDTRSKMIWPEHVNSRSQDLKTVYHDAGQWYWYNPKKIFGSLPNENTGSIILSEMEVQDIDSLDDWKIAELKYKALNLKAKSDV